MPLDDVPARRPRRIASLTAGAVAACTAVAALAAVGWARAAGHGDGPTAGPTAVATVTVTRTDLSTSRSLRGTLGYGASRPVKGARDGVVTWLPAPGAAIGRGDVLYRLNDEPVPLFIGSPPLYRTLSARNTVGRDVAMVAENLRALGYPIGAQPKPGETVLQEAPPGAPPESTPPTGGSAPPGAGTPATTRVRVQAGDGVLTTALINAIRRWQRDRGLPVDGRLDVGDVVVLPGAVRVDTVASLVGDPGTGTLLSVTATTKVVTVQAPASEVGALREHDAATVRLPDGTELTGAVGSIATVATQDGQPGGDGQTVAVTIDLADPGAAGQLDGADVTVEIAGQTHRGVLTVPVGALLALREGGYAVQCPDGRLVAVTTGLFSRGMVEISGDGVREGLTVVTTS